MTLARIFTTQKKSFVWEGEKMIPVQNPWVFSSSFGGNLLSLRIPYPKFTVDSEGQFLGPFIKLKQLFTYCCTIHG